jgi:DNA-binding transcriptional regulator of glucitol operon
MLTFTLAFAALWIVQMLLSWRQGKRFMTDIAVLRDAGVVSIGCGKRRGLRTYVALAFRDGVVTDSRTLNGVTVFARAKPHPELLGTRADALINGTVPGLDRRTAAAAAQASTLYAQRRRRKRKRTVAAL